MESRLNSNDGGSTHLDVMYCNAAYPSIEVKNITWDFIITKGDTIPVHQLKAIMRGFMQQSQGVLLKSFANNYFLAIPKLLKSKDPDFMLEFCKLMLPIFESTEHLIKNITNLLPKIPKDYYPLIRFYNETLSRLSINQRVQSSST